MNKVQIQKIIAIIGIALGAVFVVSGATTYTLVQQKLSAENISVSEDSPRYSGKAVAGPFTAYQEASMISTHALKATGGKTYAQLDREDPLRDVAMNGSFLRASLFTSVVSFGLAAFVAGVGLMFMLFGYQFLGWKSVSKSSSLGKKESPGIPGAF